MITFNTKEEATEFQIWANENSPMLPIITDEPEAVNNEFGFQETDELTKFYNDWIVG